MGILSGEKTRPAWRTEWGGGKGIFKPQAFPDKPVDVGCFYIIMPCRPKFIPTQVINQHYHDIGIGFRYRPNGSFFLIHLAVLNKPGRKAKRQQHPCETPFPLTKYTFHFYFYR